MGRLGGGAEHLLQAAQRPGDLVQELLPGRGQSHPAARSDGQLHPELAFQITDRLADPGLGEPHPFGRAAEVELLRQGDEDPDLAELDCLPHQ